MWLNASVQDDLRQGDLVSLAPMPTWPAALLDEPTQTQATVNLKWRHAVVVSQCCTIEQHRFVQLACVREIRQSDSDREAYHALRSTWPPAAGQPYHGYFHALEAHPSLVAKKQDHLFVIDLTRQVILTDALADRLATRRVARMTAESRRHLRFRLMYFYGRTEPDDAQELDSIGQADPFRQRD